jgi:hypothetical protein
MVIVAMLPKLYATLLPLRHHERVNRASFFASLARSSKMPQCNQKRYQMGVPLSPPGSEFARYATRRPAGPVLRHLGDGITSCALQ